MAFLKNIVLKSKLSNTKHRVSRNTLKRPKSHGGFNMHTVRDIELVSVNCKHDL